MKIRAKYQRPDFPYYVGNPLIEAFCPHIQGKEQLLKGLETTFELPDDIFTYDEFLARDWIGLLEDIYIPHKESWPIYLSIVQQIKVGYRNKNPFSRNGQKYINLIIQMNQNGYSEKVEKRITSITGKARCSIAMGLSGLGKSETLTSILDRIPQVISHEEYRGSKMVLEQLVWVSFDVSSTNSVKGLAVNFFRAVDEQLGTDYATKYNNYRESIDVFIGNMRMVCAKHAIGFVHIDECQHLLRRMGSDYSASVQDLESLFNRLGIPMLMTCTPEALRLFFESVVDDDIKPRLEAIRRLISERSFPFNPMELEGISYKKFFKAFLPLNVFKGTGVDTEEFKEKVHFLSFGIPAVAGRLMRLFFEAIHQNQSYLTEESSVELLTKVYDQHFNEMKIAIDMLRINQAQEWEMLQEQLAASSETCVSSTQTRTLFSSRKGPKMASERAKKRLEKDDELAACRALSDAPLQTGFSEVHK